MIQSKYRINEHKMNKVLKKRMNEQLADVFGNPKVFSKKNQIEMKQQKIAEQILKKIKIYKKMLLEQESEPAGTVADLGELPSTVADVNDQEFVKALDDEVISDDLNAIAKLFSDALGTDVEVEVIDDGIRLSNDNVNIMVRYAVDEGEPQMILVSSDSETKITISLAPLLGGVNTDNDIIKDIMSNEDIQNEIIEFFNNLLSYGEAETTIETDFSDIDNEDEEEKQEEQEEQEDEDIDNIENEDTGYLKENKMKHAFKNTGKHKVSEDTNTTVADRVLSNMAQIDPRAKLQPDSSGEYPDIYGFIQGKQTGVKDLN